MNQVLEEIRADLKKSIDDFAAEAKDKLNWKFLSPIIQPMIDKLDQAADAAVDSAINKLESKQ